MYRRAIQPIHHVFDVSVDVSVTHMLTGPGYMYPIHHGLSKGRTNFGVPHILARSWAPRHRRDGRPRSSPACPLGSAGPRALTSSGTSSARSFLLGWTPDDRDPAPVCRRRAARTLCAERAATVRPGPALRASSTSEQLFHDAGWAAAKWHRFPGLESLSVALHHQLTRAVRVQAG